MVDKMKEKENIDRILKKYENLKTDREQPEDKEPEEAGVQPENTPEEKQEEKHEKKKVKGRANVLVSVAAILLILGGLAFFLYPPILQAYNNYQQDKLQDELRKIVAENMQRAREEAEKQNEEAEPADGTAQENSGTVSLPEEPEESPDDYVFMEIPLEDEENVTSEATASATKDRLANQKVYGSIEIEKLDLFYAIVRGTASENLATGIGYMTMTDDLGEVGNCALAGHRGGKNGIFFKNLDQLENGDVVTVTNLYGESFDYVVYDSFVVAPTDVWVLNDPNDGSRMLTLITCENSGTMRLIVRAKMED